jgi:hypothetical protein
MENSENEIEKQGYNDHLLSEDFIKIYHQMNESEKESWRQLRKMVEYRINIEKEILIKK